MHTTKTKIIQAQQLDSLLTATILVASWLVSSKLRINLSRTLAQHMPTLCCARMRSAAHLRSFQKSGQGKPCSHNKPTLPNPSPKEITINKHGKQLLCPCITPVNARKLPKTSPQTSISKPLSPFALIRHAPNRRKLTSMHNLPCLLYLSIF